MQYKVRAQVTVFLTLLFGIMSALIITVIESAGNEATKIEVERIMQTAIHSCFSEYNRDFLNKYDIFAIDCSYRKNTGSIDNIKDHLKTYADRNIYNDELSAGADLYAISIDNTKLKRYELLSDNNGAPLIKQINEYMMIGDNIPEKSLLNKVKDLMALKDDGGFMEDFAKNLEKSGGVADNPAERIYELAIDSELLSNIGDEGYYCESVPGDCPSRRFLKKGTYKAFAKTGEKDDFLLNSYINEKFSNMLNPLRDSIMIGEEEYIISGLSREKDSIKECVRRILNQRENKNLKAMMENEEVLFKTEELSYELCSQSEGDPYYVQMSLIYAWAYVESLVELNHVCLRGGSVDLSEGVSNPVVPLYDLIYFEEYFGGCPNQGMDYPTILFGMLMNTDYNEKLKRCMDVMELNMIERGHEGFRIDGCVVAFSGEMSANGMFGHDFTIEREFVY